MDPSMHLYVASQFDCKTFRQSELLWQPKKNYILYVHKLYDRIVVGQTCALTTALKNRGKNRKKEEDAKTRRKE
jgi:hypothetical protein